MDGSIPVSACTIGKRTTADEWKIIATPSCTSLDFDRGIQPRPMRVRRQATTTGSDPPAGCQRAEFEQCSLLFQDRNYTTKRMIQLPRWPALPPSRVRNCFIGIYNTEAMRCVTRRYRCRTTVTTTRVILFSLMDMREISIGKSQIPSPERVCLCLCSRDRLAKHRIGAQ